MKHKANSSVLSQLFQLIVVTAIIGGLVYLVKRFLDTGENGKEKSQKGEDAEVAGEVK